MFFTGKTTKGRYAESAGPDGKTGVRRYYPQDSRAEFNAVIIAELGEPPGTEISEAWSRYTLTENGWKKD